MDRVAGRRLKHLRHHAVGVARKNIAQGRRLLLGRLQPADRKPRERPGEFDGDAGVGRQKALTDDATDGTFILGVTFTGRPVTAH